MPEEFPSAPPLLQLRGVTKRFGGITALRDVSFELRAQEIHALCGENGAGKSTLIKLLSGLHPSGSFDGEYVIAGQPVHFHSLADASRAGIAVIYQELVLVEQMTVAENIFLGTEPTRGPWIDFDQMRIEAKRLLDQFGIAIDPEAQVSELGVGQKQLIEIVKALSKKSRILILDEPTAALTEKETAILLGLLDSLRTRGVASIYISHKLDEVFAIADRITVLRDGQSVTTLPTKSTTPGDVIRFMVGREINDLFPRQTPHAQGAVVLRTKDLTVAPRPGTPARLSGITLDLHQGEVLGIGGLMGAGRSELLMHLFGAWGVRLGGEVWLDGVPVKDIVPNEAIARGMVLVTEERRRYGLVMEESIAFNLSLSALKEFTASGFIDSDREAHRNQETASRLRIKAPWLHAVVRGLSGGNQQKVVLGKALMTKPKVVLLDEPTRGIDVGAKLEVYELINQLTAAGLGILLVSSEMPELIGMSDRILILHNGTISGEFTRAEATQEALLAAALGHRSPGALSS